ADQICTRPLPDSLTQARFPLPIPPPQAGEGTTPDVSLASGAAGAIPLPQSLPASGGGNDSRCLSRKRGGRSDSASSIPPRKRGREQLLMSLSQAGRRERFPFLNPSPACGGGSGRG